MVSRVDPITQYAQDVVMGKIVACRWVRLACERHLRDLEKAEFVLDLDAAFHVFEFIELLKHHKGRQFAGRRLVLEPHQKFIIGSAFGWKMENGLRRFREIYEEVARKNGKTTEAGGVGLYGLVGEQEPGAEVYSAATKRDQAAICLNSAKGMVRHTGGLNTLCKSYTTGLFYEYLGNCFKALSKDTKSLDGLNPSLVIGDEFHAWENRATYDQIDDAFGSREQPMFYLITTAGENVEGVCYETREHVIAVLEGNEDGSYVDERIFGIIFTLDEGDDWKDEKNWVKANPNLGVSKSWDYMRVQVQKAQQIPSKQNAVLNKQFNIWTATGEQWLDMDRWKQCNGEIDLEKLKRQECYMGIDLSTIQDITAVVCVFPPGPYDEWVIVPRMFVPEDRLDLKTREDRVPVSTWHRQGHLLVTPGDVVDLEFIKKDILETADRYNVVSAGFDKWKAVEIATYLENEGMDMVQMPQGFGTMGAPSLELEKKVLARELRHAGHPVLQWMASNTVVRTDVNENICPDKKKSRKRIDGIVATIMGLGRAMVHQEDKSVYEERGFIEDD